MKKTTAKEWHDMTTLEQAEYCEMLADDYLPGFCKDQVLAQAQTLRNKYLISLLNKRK